MKQAPKANNEHKKAAKKRAMYIAFTALAAILIIVMAVVLKNASDNRSYKTYYNTAQDDYYNGDYDSALSYLRKAMNVERTQECMLLMADCYSAEGNIDKALEILRTLDTTDSQVKLRIDRLESERTKRQEAEKIVIAGSAYDVASTSLIINDRGLVNEDIGELGKLYALSNISLAGNYLTDISVLSSLGGIVNLDLSGNNISDLSPLAGHTALKVLYIDNNPIEDLTQLYTLTGLTTLSIKGIGITENELKALSAALPNCAIHSEEATEDILDISLGGMTFKSDVMELDLTGCGITDISALSSCKHLRSLNLSGNNIADLSPLMDIPGLEELSIKDNRIGDLRPLLGLSTIKTLNAEGNLVRSVAALSGLVNLEELYLSGNTLDDLSGISRLTKLKTLGIEDTGITDEDLEALYDLYNLTTAYISDNDISGEAYDKLHYELPACQIYHSELVYTVEFGGEKYKEDITVLEASNKGISDISPITQFKCLETVRLANNCISNIYSFEWTHGIRELDLSGNDIEDITVIATMTDLRVLNLSDNRIVSVTPLLKLTNLEELYIGGNNIAPELLEVLKSALPNCVIHC